MKDSLEVKLFKGEVNLYKQRLKNSNISSRANVIRTIIGTPIYDVNNPDENLEVGGLENGVVSNNTYTLSTGYVSADGIMITYKSQKDKYRIIRGFLEHIYIYYNRNSNLYQNWVWPSYTPETNQENVPPQLIIDNFKTKDLFLSMINEPKFNFFNDRKIILHLINLEEYYKNNKQSFLNILQTQEEQTQEEQTQEEQTQVETQVEEITENSLFFDNLLNTEQNTDLIFFTNMNQYIYVSVDDKKYIFSNQESNLDSYNENQKYFIGLGSYIFKNIPENHPIAFLNHDNIDNIVYIGDINKQFSKNIMINNENRNYNFYWGDINVHVFGDFNSISIFCYYHGYMGGENILFYTPNITQNYITNITNNTNKKKILCLHGYSETAENFENQQGMQDLINSVDLNEYEFIFVNSPLNNNKWWEDPVNNTPTDINHANISINYLIDYINNNGPFYGILGYSQGASMAIIILANTTLIFERVLLFNGFLPEIHQGLIDTINIVKPLGEIPLIFLGNNDTNYYDLGLNIKTFFNNSNQIISDIAGHALPVSTDPTFQSVINYITNGYQDNTGPTNITLSNNTIDENVAINSIIGYLLPVGGTPPYTFELSGNYRLYFLLDTNETNKLLTNNIYDYETQNQYNLNVIIRDYYNLSYEKEFIIYIENIYD